MLFFFAVLGNKSIFASVTKNLLMGFFDKKPKKDSGLFGSKYEPDAWRKHITV